MTPSDGKLTRAEAMLLAQGKDPNELLGTRATAEMLGGAKKISWLTKARLRGEGPPFVRTGKSVEYRRATVLEYVLEQEDRSKEAARALCERREQELGRRMVSRTPAAMLQSRSSSSASSQSRDVDADSRQVQQTLRELRRLARASGKPNGRGS